MELWNCGAVAQWRSGGWSFELSTRRNRVRTLKFPYTNTIQTIQIPLNETGMVLGGIMTKGILMVSEWFLMIF